MQLHEKKNWFICFPECFCLAWTFLNFLARRVTYYIYLYFRLYFKILERIFSNLNSRIIQWQWNRRSKTIIWRVWQIIGTTCSFIWWCSSNSDKRIRIERYIFNDHHYRTFHVTARLLNKTTNDNVATLRQCLNQCLDNEYNKRQWWQRKNAKLFLLVSPEQENLIDINVYKKKHILSWKLPIWWSPSCQISGFGDA